MVSDTPVGGPRGRIGRALAACLAALTLLLPSAAALAQAAEQRMTLSRTLTFVDGKGRPVSSADFAGKWLLVYFGYMHCSDLCPWGLTVMGAALDQIGTAADHLQPLFVTVDPERDRGEALIEFAASFHERLVGLTGSDEEIRSAAAALGVSYQKVAQGADYTVDHSSVYSLIDPSRTRVVTFRKAEPHMIAAKVVEELDRAGVRLEAASVGAYR